MVPIRTMAVGVGAAPVRENRDHAGTGPTTTGVKRRRVDVGSMEQYDDFCCLCEGSFGAVFKARHRATGQAVAIKLVSPLLGGPLAALREAAFLEASSRDNPFVVGFHGIARHPATMDLCLVMECGGRSLSDVLRQLRPRTGSPTLPEATVCAVMWQLLTGTKKMHDRHIVHGDIKPRNILISDDYKCVKICDFGLAVHMAERPPYEVAGTLRYMAPEMLLGKTDYDALVDTWSLGCVMAELINGRRLFEGESEEDQLCTIFELLGAPDETTWPWFSSTDFAADVMQGLDMRRDSLLRHHFPETKLSDEGFEVLSGLLTCNPDKRLTAAAALKLPWFARIFTPGLPKKVEVASPLTKRPRMCVA